MRCTVALAGPPSPLAAAVRASRTSFVYRVRFALLFGMRERYNAESVGRKVRTKTPAGATLGCAETRRAWGGWRPMAFQESAESQAGLVADRAELEELASGNGPLTPEECADRAARAATTLDL